MSDEVQVSTYISGDQQYPAIAVRRDGSFVVVWESSGQDGSDFGIFGQRYNTLGGKVGLEFQVNTYTTGAQRFPSAAADEDGGFVVVWQSDGQDGSSTGVFGQRFDASGSKIGSEFSVNTYTTDVQSGPRVSGRGDGSFVVVWESLGQDASSYGVFGQRFDASGAKVGSEFPVNTFTTGDHRSPAVAVDHAGNFVVVWQGNFQDGDQFGILGQRFDGSGTRVGPEFPVNAYTLLNEITPSVGMDRAGNFVVSWAREYLGPAGYDIRAQRFNSGGEKAGGEIVTGEFGQGPSSSNSIAVDDAGNFLLATSVGGSLHGERFDKTGQKLDTPFSFTGFGGANVAAGVDPAGDFVVAWGRGDYSGYGVFARRSNISPAPLQVDAHAVGGATVSVSDVNGVLEPEETVAVEPAWKNIAGKGGISPTGITPTGTASNFTGPAGGTYAILDQTADYGLILAGATGNCYQGTLDHDCYLLSVGKFRPAVHWDASFDETLSIGGLKRWKIHIGDSFRDVPRSQSFYRKIETLLHHGITTGCTASEYCPDQTVARDQMAIFIAKGIAGLGENVPSAGSVSGNPFDCSPGGVSIFADVQPTDPFCKHVHYLAARNVTLGCGPATYCPNQEVTRDAMASFIAKAVLEPGGGAAVPLTYGPDPDTGRSYSCDPGSPNLHFTDVSATDACCKHIHYLWGRGVVDGCSSTQYCPSAPVQRDAMAKFIANAFGLQLYGR